jgi:hypothetical protein
MRAITPRALGIGLVMVVVIVGMTQALSVQASAADVGAGSPPPAPTYLLFLYAALLAPLLLRLNRRFALSPGELLFVYGLIIVVGPISHAHCMGFLVPHTVAPLYYNAEEPGWAVFQPVLRLWLGPNTRQAVTGFFHGTGGVVPWAAWLLPLVAWSSLLIALFFVMLCVNVLMRRQWVDNERLTFPLAAIPVALAGDEERGLSRTLRQPLFWLGVVLPLLLRMPGSLHRYFPVIPELPLQEVPILYANQLSPPWKGVGDLTLSLSFWLVGVAYLIPTELAFSAWFFYGVSLLENVTAVWAGLSGERPDVYSNQFPALYAQGAGAAFALTGITLYMARHHLRDALRKALRGDPAVDDSGEFLSYRTAFWGAILGIAFMLAWFCLAGMRLWVAALLLGMMLAYFFVFARIRAETGLGLGVILWPKMLDEVMMTFVGAKFLTLADTTTLYALRWLYFGSPTGSVMGCQMEGFKLVGAGRERARGAGWTLALVVTAVVPLAFLWTLRTYYLRGFEGMPAGNRSMNMVGSQIYWSYQNLVNDVSSPTGPQWNGILAMSGGALIAIALSWLRARFLWFPLHPVGFIAANSWGMQLNWFSFLLGWLLKALVTRWGGMRTYQRLLPLFLGLIVGDMVHEGVWGIVTWATGGRQY